MNMTLAVEMALNNHYSLTDVLLQHMTPQLYELNLPEFS